MFKDLFKSRDKIEKELREKFDRERLESIKQEEELRQKIERERIQSLKESNVPWCEPIPHKEDSIHITERFHYNDAFLRDLKRQGITGSNDAELLTNWLNKEEYDKRQAIIEEERAKKRAGKEPYVEVIGESFDESGERFALTLDWNAPFVHMLRLQGFRGATDEQVVQNWLTNLERDTAGDFQ